MRREERWKEDEIMERVFKKIAFFIKTQWKSNIVSHARTRNSLLAPTLFSIIERESHQITNWFSWLMAALVCTRRRSVWRYDVHAVAAPLIANTAGMNWMYPSVLRMDENTEKNMMTAVTVEVSLCKEGVWTTKRASWGVSRNWLEKVKGKNYELDEVIQIRVA